MTNAELIKVLRECEYCNVCSIAVDGDCPFGGRDALEVAAAIALEAAEKRIDNLQQTCDKLASNLQQAQLPKEGEWTTKRTWDHDGEIYCSVCDHDAPTEGDYRQVKTNYCPNCGARMRGEHDEQIH